MKSYLSDAFYLVFFIFLILSFFCFAPNYDPFYNSDLAVHVLMTESFSWPEDLYYWGQDRLGSIVPMLAFGLKGITTLTPIQAVAIVQYLFVGGSLLLFASFVRDPLLRIALAIVWFFPLVPFREVMLIAHPDAPQLFLIGLMLFSFKKVSEHHQKIVWVIVACLAGCASLWVSELSIIPVIIFGSFFLLMLFSNPTFSLKDKAVLLITSLLIIIVGIKFILFAKSTAIKVPEYAILFVSSQKALVGLIKLIELFKETVLGVNTRIETTVAVDLFMVFFLISITSILINVKKGKPVFNIRTFVVPLHMKLFLSSIIIFALVIYSHWAHLNDLYYRFFILPYTFFVVGFVSYLDVNKERLFKGILPFVLVVSLACAWSSASQIISSTGKLSPKLSQLNEFKELGKIAIIGDYWHSYIVASLDPSNISATPHDKAYVRSEKEKNRVISNDTIYIVRNYWMESFPDSLNQFNITLYKRAYEFNIRDFDICMYVKAK